MRTSFLCLLAITSLLLARSQSQADGADKTKHLGRSILAKYANIIATVRIEREVQIRSSNRVLTEFRQNAEVVATIIRADGLAVLSGFRLDVGTFTTDRTNSPAPEGETAIRTHVVKENVEIRFRNGQTVRAAILGRDKQSDLVFVQPATRLKGVPHFRWAEDASVGWGDHLLVLSISSKRLQYRSILGQLSVVAERDSAGGPAILDGGTGCCPVFDAHGRAAGLVSDLDDRPSSEFFTESHAVLWTRRDVESALARVKNTKK